MVKKKENNTLQIPKIHYKKSVTKYKDNDIIKVYSSIRECSREEHIGRGTMCKIINNELIYNGYTYKIKNIG